MPIDWSKRPLILVAVFGAILSLQGCELLFELGELDIAAGAGEAVVAGEALGAEVAAGEFAGGAAQLRALALDLPENALLRGGLRAGLEMGMEETAAGRAVTISTENEIIARGRTWGRISANREIMLRRPGSAIETPVGKLSNGLIWAPDEGGNMLPVARIRGSLRPLSYSLRNTANGSPTGVKLFRDTPIDILRTRDGWYEVRVAGNRATGWISTASLSVTMVAAEGIDKVAGAILTCAEHDSVAGIGHRVPRGSETNIEHSLRLILRYPENARSKANTVASSLRNAGFEVVRQEVDVPSTETCGGEIYYHRDDFQTARSIQGLLAPIDRLRISSFSIDESRMLIWLR